MFSKDALPHREVVYFLIVSLIFVQLECGNGFRIINDHQVSQDILLPFPLSQNNISSGFSVLSKGVNPHREVVYSLMVFLIFLQLEYENGS